MSRSNVDQLEEFKKSHIWQDILVELRIWLKEVHKMLENQNGDVSSRSLDRLGGNAEAFHKFEDILDYMMNDIKVEQEERERELKRERENGE